MAHRTHQYQIQFHQAPEPGAPFRWEISPAQQVTALSPDTAIRLARHLLRLDHTWQVRECQDLGRWDRVL
jgi:hypothetical protein